MHLVHHKDVFTSHLWQHDPMIVAGTYPPISIDFGNDEPDMILQREYRESGYRVWRDVMKDGEAVKSPVDIDELQWGKYQVVE